MRDDYGGLFMVRLFLVFIVIYVAFTAISLNYAKAFRTKNKVIDYIEENEIMKLSDASCDAINSILRSTQYTKKCVNGDGPLTDESGKTASICCGGVVINLTNQANSINHYEVLTYADWSLGSLNMILALGGKDQKSERIVNGRWEVKGEAKVRITEKEK